jgi:hypothetical protein
MHQQENESKLVATRDPFSVLILVVCSTLAIVLGVAGLFSFLDSKGTPSESIVRKDLFQRVRDGELSDQVVRMAYDEVKRLSKTPSAEQLYWDPSATNVNGGLLISGVVRVPNGSMKEFFVKFRNNDKKIVASEIKEE